MGTVRNARVNQGGPKCAGIVGLGLIGGSFARGYAQAGVRVLAWDPDDDVMTAASMGTVAGELNDKTLGECDIIVLACYPEACIEWLEAHAQALADATDTDAIMGPVVIDTVGVKGIVCERAFELAREHGFYFVGAHPMAGTQFSGYATLPRRPVPGRPAGARTARGGRCAQVGAFGPGARNGASLGALASSA